MMPSDNNAHQAPRPLTDDELDAVLDMADDDLSANLCRALDIDKGLDEISQAAAPVDPPATEPETESEIRCSPYWK